MTNKSYATGNLFAQCQRGQYQGGSCTAFAVAIFLLSLIGAGVAIVYLG